MNTAYKFRLLQKRRTYVTMDLFGDSLTRSVKRAAFGHAVRKGCKGKPAIYAIGNGTATLDLRGVL